LGFLQLDWGAERTIGGKKIGNFGLGELYLQIRNE